MPGDLRRVPALRHPQDLAQKLGDLRVIAAGAGPERQPSTVSQKVRSDAVANGRAVLTEYVDFLSVPIVAADPANLRRNAERLAELLRKRGLEVKLLEEGGPPVVFAQLRTPSAKRTLAFFGHYDGQPADKATWSGGEPWTPVLRDKPLAQGGKVVALAGAASPLDPDTRLYARSASDGKAPVMAMLDLLGSARGPRRGRLVVLFRSSLPSPTTTPSRSAPCASNSSPAPAAAAMRRRAPSSTNIWTAPSAFTPKASGWPVRS